MWPDWSLKSVVSFLPLLLTKASHVLSVASLQLRSSMWPLRAFPANSNHYDASSSDNGSLRSRRSQKEWAAAAAEKLPADASS